MTFEEEKYIFDKISIAFDDLYFISSTPGCGWAVFFKIENEKVYICSLKKIGWCAEVPDQTIDELLHISSKKIDENTLCLIFNNNEKIIKLSPGPAIHYWGR